MDNIHKPNQEEPNDIIFIHDLKIKTIIGVNPFEKQIKQILWFNLELHTDITKTISDNLDDTIDYSKIASTIQEFCSTNHFNLIECLAENITNILFTTFTKIQQITLSIKKPGAIPNAQTVGIKITRKHPHQ